MDRISEDVAGSSPDAPKGKQSESSTKTTSGGDEQFKQELMLAYAQFGAGNFSEVSNDKIFEDAMRQTAHA